MCLQADYYPEYLYTSVILLEVDHPSQLGSQKESSAGAGSNSKQPLRRSSTVAPGAPRDRRASDSGSVVHNADAPLFGGQMSRVLRTRLFGAAGAKKRQVERQAAAAGRPAALLPMQPTVEQASIFLFR